MISDAHDKHASTSLYGSHYLTAVMHICSYTCPDLLPLNDFQNSEPLLNGHGKKLSTEKLDRL